MGEHNPECPPLLHRLQAVPVPSSAFDTDEIKKDQVSVGIIPTKRNQDLPAWKEGNAALLADVTGTDRASETQPLTASQKTQGSYQETK